MTSSTGLNSFSRHYPERFFDVGIAEQHAVTLAAGLAKEGYHPVVTIYSTFYNGLTIKFCTMYACKNCL